MSYPGTTKVKLKALHNQPTMPNPCVAIPANPWCPAHAHAVAPNLTPRIATSSFAPPWPYSGILVVLAVAAAGWRRIRSRVASIS
jgi:hypothetical protein